MEDIRNELLAKRNNPKEFFAQLYCVWSTEYQNKEKTLPQLIVKLNKDENIDFCQIAADAINDSFRCFNVPPVLEGVLPELNLKTKSVLNLIERLHEGMQGDMAAHFQFKPFEGLLAKQPIFFRALLAELLKEDKPYIVGYVSNFYQSLSKGNEHEIHNELCTLKEHKSVYVLMAIVDALGALDYKTSQNRPLVKETFAVFQELEKKKSNEIDRTLTFSYMNLFGYLKDAKNKVVTFSENDQLLVQQSVSHVLFLSQEELGNEPWFSNALSNLSYTSCKNKGIINNLDYVLAGLIEKSDNANLAENFFVEWVLSSDYLSTNDRLCDLFSSTLAAFVNNRGCLEGLLTRFLNHDNQKLHNAASEITSYCQLHKVNHLNLNKQTIKNLTYDDCLFLCRKILGYIVNPDYLCSLCFSMLDALPKNKNIQRLVYEIFSFHIGENYPGRTLDFLKPISVETKSINKKRVVDQVIQDIDRYISQRNSLPRLKELIPSRQKARRIFRESNKKMSAAMEEAQKGSIVSMLASKSTLKQGTGWFHFMGGKYSEASKLGCFSTEAEIPRSEVTHPVDAARELFGFREAKRGEK